MKFKEVIVNTLLFLVLLGVLILTSYFLLNSSDFYSVTLAIKKLGFVGLLICFIMWMIMCVPLAFGSFILGVSTGFIFGFWKGFLVGSLGVTFGSTFVFFFCKKFLTKSAETLMSRNQQLSAVATFMKENSLLFSLMIRMTPIPMGFQNAILSVSVDLKRYLISIPGSFLELSISLSPFFFFTFPSKHQIFYFYRLVGSQGKELLDLLYGKEPLTSLQIGFSHLFF